MEISLQRDLLWIILTESWCLLIFQASTKRMFDVGEQQVCIKITHSAWLQSRGAVSEFLCCYYKYCPWEDRREGLAPFHSPLPGMSSDGQRFKMPKSWAWCFSLQRPCPRFTDSASKPYTIPGKTDLWKWSLQCYLQLKRKLTTSSEVTEFRVFSLPWNGCSIPS